MLLSRLVLSVTSLKLCGFTPLGLSQTTGVYFVHFGCFCSFLTIDRVSTPLTKTIVDRIFLQLSVSITSRRLVESAPPKLAGKGATATEAEKVGVLSVQASFDKAEVS